MKIEILLATNNQGKVERYRKLASQINPNVVLHTLEDLNIETIKIDENGTLEENAKKKAYAYLGKTKLPILANDAGFFVKGIGLIKNPKRIALNSPEENFSKEEIYEIVVNYWKGVARRNGGRVDAAWVDAFSLFLPNGKYYKEGARREVILTDKILGETHVQFPMRALYVSKKTNKPAALHSEEEEFSEVIPIKKALSNLFKMASRI